MSEKRRIVYPQPYRTTFWTITIVYIVCALLIIGFIVYNFLPSVNKSRADKLYESKESFLYNEEFECVYSEKRIHEKNGTKTQEAVSRFRATNKDCISVFEVDNLYEKGTKKTFDRLVYEYEISETEKGIREYINKDELSEDEFREYADTQFREHLLNTAKQDGKDKAFKAAIVWILVTILWLMVKQVISERRCYALR